MTAVPVTQPESSYAPNLCHPERSASFACERGTQSRDLAFPEVASGPRVPLLRVHCAECIPPALYISASPTSCTNECGSTKPMLSKGSRDDYSAVRFVYWESFDSVQYAIAREKQLKNGCEKKLWFIARMNPSWKDPAAGWYETQGPSTSGLGARSQCERASSLGMTQSASSRQL